MNTIEDLLASMLQDLAILENISESLRNEFQNAFTRAANLYHRILIEFGMPKQVLNDMREVPYSYLSDLVKFLRHSRDPFYALRVCDNMLLFTQKLHKLKKSLSVGLTDPFLSFAMCFLKYFRHYDFDLKNFLLLAKRDLNGISQNPESFAARVWRKDRTVTLFKLFPEYSAAIEHFLLDQIPSIPPSTPVELGLKAAGELCFGSIFQSGLSSQAKALVISAIAAASFEILSNIITIREFSYYFFFCFRIWE